MCSSNLNPFSTNNIIVRGALAGATMGGSELLRAGYQASKPPPAPTLPSMPEAPQSERAPTIAVPKRRTQKGPVVASPTSTTLTGPLGIDPAQLVIGRNAFLGQ